MLCVLQKTSALSTSLLLGSLVLLLACGRPTLANTRTCFTHLQIAYTVPPSTQLMDVTDDYHTSFLMTCDKAERYCYKYMISHLTSVLGYQVAPLRYSGAGEMCKRLKREILPTAPAHVSAHWTVSNCDRTGYTYLGQICCWAYKIGKAAFYVANPDCSQCTKPPCEDDRNSTTATVTTIKGNRLTTGRFQDLRTAAVNEEEMDALTIEKDEELENVDSEEINDTFETEELPERNE